MKNKTTYTFEDFQNIIARLRAKDGCPWDQVQTHESLRDGMLEEAYEVVEGTVTEIHAELLFDGFKRVLVQGDDGITTELLLNKETVVMYGKAYRFYFNQNAHAFSGIRRLDAAFDFGNFFGVEEVKE